MDASSFIAFGVLFLSASICMSLVLGTLLSIAKPYSQNRNPWLERYAAACTLAVPPLVGGGLTVILALRSVVSSLWGADHCLEHPHHLHLCVTHGENWIFTPWACVLVFLFFSFVLFRSGHTIWIHVKAQILVNRLKNLGRALEGTNCCFVVPSQNVFAFTAGIISPAVIISDTAWALLDTNERTAVLAHERHHITSGDLWKRALLGIVSYCGVPLLSKRALSIWEMASERMCDSDAARQVGKPTIVASALVTLARSYAERNAPAGAICAASCNVHARIDFLFKGEAHGGCGAKKAASSLCAMGALATAIGVLFSESLHHFFETILG